MARLIPVNYDPFIDNEENNQAQAPKLVPVDYDPFATDGQKNNGESPATKQPSVESPDQENENSVVEKALSLSPLGIAPKISEYLRNYEFNTEDVPEFGRENPNLWAAMKTAEDIGVTAAKVTPEALAWSLPALATAGAAPVAGLTSNALQGASTLVPMAIKNATALERAVAATPTAARTLLTGLATGTKEGIESISAGDSAGEFIDDVGKGALTGTVVDYGFGKAIEGVGKGIGLAREYLPKALRMVGSGLSDDMAKTRAGKILLETSDNLQLDKIDDAISKAERIETALNDGVGPHDKTVRFNSAETFQDAPGLTSLNQKLSRRNSKAVEKAVLHRGEMNRAVSDLLDRGAGAKGTGTLDDTVMAARRGVDDFNNGIHGQENALQQEFMSKAGETPTLDVSGAAGRHALENQRRGVKLNTVNPAYDEVADVQVDTAGLQRKFSDIMRPTSRGENPENIPSGFITRARQAMTQGVDNSVSADLATLRDLEKEARQLKVNARSAQGNANQSLARRYQQIEEAIRGTIDNAGDTVAPEAQKLRQANAAFKEYAETYKEGSAGQVLRKSGYEYRIPDSKVISKFFPKGDAGAQTAAAQFRRAARGDQTAWQALEDGVIRDMIDTVAPNGKVEPGKFASWYRQHRSALQQYPELRKRVGNVQRAQSALDDFWSRAGNMRKQTESKALSSFLKSDVDRAMGRILGSANPEQEMTNLLNLVGDNHHAQNGIKSEILRHIKNSATTVRKINGKNVLSESSMKKAYSRLKPTMQKVYSPRELQDIEIAIEAEEMMTSAWNPMLSGSNTSELMVSSGSIDKIAATTKTATGLVTRSALAVLDGLLRLSKGTMGKAGFDRTEQILMRAMDNPSFLRELVDASRSTKPEWAISVVVRKYGADGLLKAAGKTVQAGSKESVYSEVEQ